MSSSWLQGRLRQAEELLHAVDRTAKAVSTEVGGSKDPAGKLNGPEVSACRAETGAGPPFEVIATTI
jgi:hypothetical protein